ncbi:serine/threonine-protein kinase [Pseudonocardia acaciae]|uniref:serine/threonine-protein kinase n=1 Tax=Pseudonocardia acaciae TaxID=551276 RepID=UPI0006844096|nr:serine/threonine-protein kinase [Pseudonocardia acaciae]
MRTLWEDDPAELGGYRIVGRLGTGGMGQVYLGRDRGGRCAAVKVVHPGLADDPAFRARFAREVATARAIDAPWTAAVLGADPGAARPWLATEYVPGPSLEQAVAGSGPLPAPAVRVLAARMAEALAGLHAAGVVHRDVKPSNVILAEDGPRLIDFGISTATDATDATRITHTGAMLGTPAYMSPEQASDEPVGAASDLFSLASVLVFAATGRGPFGEASNPVALLLRIARDEPRLAGVPDELRPALQRCLAKDPAARPAAADLAAGLAPEPGRSAAWFPPGVVTPTARIDPAADSTWVVPTLVVARRTAGGNRKLWLGLAGALTLVTALAVTMGVTGPTGPTGPAGTPARYTTAAEISNAVDAQLERDRTVKASSTREIHPTRGEMRWTSEAHIRVDSGTTSLHRTMHLRQVTHPEGGGNDVVSDWDSAMIVLPGRAWLTKSTRAPQQPTAVSWDALDLTGNDPARSVELAVVRAAADEGNPLRPNVAAATLVDSADEQLDGVPTRRYTLRLDRDATLQLKADPNWRPSGPLPPPDPASTITNIVWLDAANRLVRFRAEHPSPAPRQEPNTHETRYREWGQPVRIEPPPPNQITTG